MMGGYGEPDGPYRQTSVSGEVKASNVVRLMSKVSLSDWLTIHVVAQVGLIRSSTSSPWEVFARMT
jgi:hypothetical protein